MQFVWDEQKREKNFAKHGLDFAEIELGFDFEHALVLPARPSRLARARFQLIGKLGGQLLVAVIVSPLGTQGLSIISLRPASKKETRNYER